jgi:hypothetical protein
MRQHKVRAASAVVLRRWTAHILILTAALSITSVQASLAVTGFDAFRAHQTDPALSELFGDPGEWSPQGQMVADSGFRPYPDGFGFLNFGEDLAPNQIVFGQPEPLVAGGAPATPTSLNAADMRATFGPAVCLGNRAEGPCTLTYSAEVVRNLTTDWALNGRCFGMANVAAGLFSGVVSPRELRTGLVNSMTTLNPETQRRILRAVASQYFSATGYPVTSMASLVQVLTTGLQPGIVPVTLLLYGEPGGHALTPYAVFKRGEGSFDIAVYDSNLPQQARALRVDTTANTFAYQGLRGLTGTPALWTNTNSTNPASIWVGSVPDALRQQECTFCTRSSSPSIVNFSPVLRENVGVLESVKVLDAQGQPLAPDLYEIIEPLDSMPGPLVGGPSIRVNAGIPFAIALSGSDVRTLQPLTVTIIRDGTTRQVEMDALTVASSGVVGVGATARSISVLGQPFERIRVRQTVEVGSTSYSFRGTQLTGETGGGLFMRLGEDRKVVIFKDNRTRSSQWQFDFESKRGKFASRFVSRVVKVPKGARVMADYTNWSGDKGAPQAWIDRGSDGSRDIRIPLRKQ